MSSAGFCSETSQNTKKERLGAEAAKGTTVERQEAKEGEKAKTPFFLAGCGGVWSAPPWKGEKATPNTAEKRPAGH